MEDNCCHWWLPHELLALCSLSGGTAHGHVAVMFNSELS